MLSPKYYGQLVLISGGLSMQNLSRLVTGFCSRYYSKDKGPRCVDPSPRQCQERTVQMPRCPGDHANLDPYRIKVPEVAVPPLPPNNAKEMNYEEPEFKFDQPQQRMDYQTMFGADASRIHDTLSEQYVHPDYWKNLQQNTYIQTTTTAAVLPKLGYHGEKKLQYAFHEPWKPLDRMKLLEEAAKEELGETTEPNGGENFTKEIV